jgi:hypothetical protein
MKGKQTLFYYQCEPKRTELNVQDGLHRAGYCGVNALALQSEGARFKSVRIAGILTEVLRGSPQSP